MAMSFEYFLKALAASGGITLPNKATLIPIIQKLMKQQRVWISLFNLNSGLTSGSSLADFLTNVSQLLSDIQFQQSEDHYIARCFLMACLARNLSVHHYPTADWFYGDLFHDMLNAVVYAMFYSWQIAKREHWG